MRYILAAVLICALSLPAAHARSSSSSTKAAASAKPAKTAAKNRSGGADLGGIHPLVGSGGY